MATLGWAHPPASGAHVHPSRTPNPTDDALDPTDRVGDLHRQTEYPQRAGSHPPISRVGDPAAQSPRHVWSHVAWQSKWVCVHGAGAATPPERRNPPPRAASISLPSPAGHPHRPEGAAPISSWEWPHREGSVCAEQTEMPSWMRDMHPEHRREDLPRER